MAKIRIHEIAKELNVPAKEVMSFLDTKNIEVKSHMSTLEDNSEKIVRDQFGKKAEVLPKKKSSITAVYNPQNSNHPGKRTQQRQTQGERVLPKKETGNMNITAQTTGTVKTEATAATTTATTAATTATSTVAVSTTPSASNTTAQRTTTTNTSQGDRPRYNNNRPQGDRPRYNNNAPQGDRPR